MRTPMPFSTTRRSRSVGRARASCAAFCPSPSPPKWADSAPEASAEVCQDAWPDVRDADELQDVLQTLIALPEELAAPGRPAPREVWGRHFEQLHAQGRAARALVPGQAVKVFW